MLLTRIHADLHSAVWLVSSIRAGFLTVTAWSSVDPSQTDLLCSGPIPQYTARYVTTHPPSNAYLHTETNSLLTCSIFQGDQLEIQPLARKAKRTPTVRLHGIIHHKISCGRLPYNNTEKSILSKHVHTLLWRFKTTCLALYSRKLHFNLNVHTYLYKEL